MSNNQTRKDTMPQGTAQMVELSEDALESVVGGLTLEIGKTPPPPQLDSDPNPTSEWCLVTEDGTIYTSSGPSLLSPNVYLPKDTNLSISQVNPSDMF